MDRYQLAGMAGTSMARYIKRKLRERDLEANYGRYAKRARVKPRFIKSTQKRYKKRKTTKSKCAKVCRAIVKKELKKEENVGTYLKNYAGFVKWPLTNTVNEQTDAGLWSQTIDQVWTRRKDLSFFTPAYLMDVASVLFNGKAASLEPITTGNFSKISDLKFTVYSAKATITFRNCSKDTIDFTVFEITTKELEEEDFGTDWLRALESTNMTQVGGTIATPFTHGQSPLQLKGLWKRYKMVQKKKILRPGEMLSHTVSMPKNFMFNGVEYYDSNVVAKFAKFSKQIWYKYTSLIQPCVWQEQGGVSCLEAGRPLIKRNIDSNFPNAGIVIDVKESYRIGAPKNTPEDKKVDAYCLYNQFGNIEGKTILRNFEIAPSYSLAYDGFLPNNLANP